MGQYDYQGTSASRMYDWLVTRNGDSLSLCIGDLGIESDAVLIQQEDLEYIRGLVEGDHDKEKTIFPAGSQQLHVDAYNALADEVDAQKARSGGVDYYDQVDPKTGKKKGIPEPLEPTPPPSRRHLDEDGRWVEGDKEVEEIKPTQEEIDA